MVKVLFKKRCIPECTVCLGLHSNSQWHLSHFLLTPLVLNTHQWHTGWWYVSEEGREIHKALQKMQDTWRWIIKLYWLVKKNVWIQQVHLWSIHIVNTALKNKIKKRLSTIYRKCEKKKWLKTWNIIGKNKTKQNTGHKNDSQTAYMDYSKCIWTQHEWNPRICLSLESLVIFFFFFLFSSVEV